MTLRPRLPICGCRLSCRRLWAPGWGRSCPSGRARGQKAAAETRGPHIPTSPRATSPGRDPVSSVVRKHCSKKLNSLVWNYTWLQTLSENLPIPKACINSKFIFERTLSIPEIRERPKNFTEVLQALTYLSTSCWLQPNRGFLEIQKNFSNFHFSSSLYIDFIVLYIYRKN